MSEWSPDIAKLQARDEDEWLRVEREYAGRLYHYVAKRVPDRDARSDVLQETLMGAVRGIDGFDPIYTFEQYIFGICHNRTIDFLRRKKHETIQTNDDDAPAPIERLATETDTPSQVVRRADFSKHARTLLASLWKRWVEETWSEGEFVRLMVIEALFHGGWRNKDTWRRFDLRDETSVAGIKFRALNRLRELVTHDARENELYVLLSGAVESGEASFDFDAGEVWREARVSCPARYWLARRLAGNLQEGPKTFIDFHLDEMKCAYCQANVDDLRGAQAAELVDLHDDLRRSTLRSLRSRPGGG